MRPGRCKPTVKGKSEMKDDSSYKGLMVFQPSPMGKLQDEHSRDTSSTLTSLSTSG